MQGRVHVRMENKCGFTLGQTTQGPPLQVGYSELPSIGIDAKPEGNAMFKDKERWSSSEVKILHENFESFLQMNKIKDKHNFLYSNDPETRAKRVSLGFVEHMINRLTHKTRRAVIYKIKREILTLKHGNLSKNEIEELCLLQRSCGNRWMEIARIMGRNPDRLGQKYERVSAENKLKDRQRFGKWTQKEITAFNKAIDSLKVNYNCLNRKRHQKTKIDWKAVSNAVGSRSLL